MEPRLKRRLVIGAAGAAVAAGAAGAAYGVTQNSHDSERHAFLNDAARRLNVSPQKLSDALKGAFLDRLDAAVKAGRITQAQADRIKQRLEQKDGLPFFGPGLRRFHHGPFLKGFGAGPFFGGIDAAAKYLGLTDQQLGDQLASGKSLAQVAKDKGKSVDGLKSAIRDSVKSRLDQAVKDKRITQEEENRILSDLDSRLDDIVNGTPPRLHRWRGRPPGAPPGRPPFIF